MQTQLGCRINKVSVCWRCLRSFIFVFVTHTRARARRWRVDILIYLVDASLNLPGFPWKRHRLRLEQSSNPPAVLFNGLTSRIRLLLQPTVINEAYFSAPSIVWRSASSPSPYRLVALALELCCVAFACCSDFFFTFFCSEVRLAAYVLLCHWWL